MTSGRPKRTSILLRETQIDFLTNLARKIEKGGRKKISRCKIMEVLTKTLTCIKPDISECRNEEEIERELLKCFKKAVSELKR